MALLKVLPEIVRESAKPLEATDSIKIVQADGIAQNGGGRVGNGGNNTSGNLASEAVSAAFSYRAQAPTIDGLMKELGLDGSSLEKLVAGGSGYEHSLINREQVNEVQTESLSDGKNRRNRQQKLEVPPSEEGAA